MSNKLIVAYNWDKKLLDELSQEKQVEWVFAKKSIDFIGGGRPAHALQKISKSKAKEHINYAQENGIKFNYLFNAACLGNKEFTPKGLKAIIKEIDWAVYEAKVDAITVANNYLLGLIRKRYPKVKVGLGMYMLMWDLDQFKFYDDLGVDWITIQYSANRQLAFLEKLRKNIKCELQLIVNTPCLLICPYGVYHPNLISHRSQKSNLASYSWVDPLLWNCNCEKIFNPKQLVRASYIRPEDLILYEKMGFNNFKIAGRNNSTAWIIRVTQAYAQKHYKGNLLDILDVDMLKTKDKACVGSQQNFIKYYLKNYKATKHWLNIYYNDYQKAYPYINNQKFSEYLQRIQKRGCNFIRVGDCASCNHCEKTAKQVISYKNKKSKNRLISDFNKAINMFLNDELFEVERQIKP